jgi:CTP-dependent riboflavin kinase
MSFKTVKLTIFSQDDLEDAKKSQRELLKNRVVRLTNEAFEQGTLLTQADLSILLNESIKTIGRHIKKLLEEDIVVPTRGNRMDIGPGTSHKAKIVELYLKGYEFTEIKRNTRHSSDSIARYLKEFARVAALHHEGYSLDQIRRITEHSEKLVKEYLELYERYKEEENCKQWLGEILSRYSGEKTLSGERARAKEVM